MERKHLNWSTVNSGNQELVMKHIKNIFRGHQFEDVAIVHFKRMRKCKTIRSGFFYFTNSIRYSSSSDALGPLAILHEVKTWIERSMSLLESLDKVPQYFVQCQLLMLLTDFCVYYTGIASHRNKNSFFY